MVRLRLETNAAETFGFTFWLSAVATALLMFVGPPRRGGGRSANLAGPVDKERPVGEPHSSEEPRDLEFHRAHERGRGRHATHPLRIPWKVVALVFTLAGFATFPLAIAAVVVLPLILSPIGAGQPDQNANASGAGRFSCWSC